jgi:hypothetical protein
MSEEPHVLLLITISECNVIVTAVEPGVFFCLLHPCLV